MNQTKLNHKMLFIWKIQPRLWIVHNEKTAYEIKNTRCIMAQHRCSISYQVIMASPLPGPKLKQSCHIWRGIYCLSLNRTIATYNKVTRWPLLICTPRLKEHEFSFNPKGTPNPSPTTSKNIFFPLLFPVFFLYFLQPNVNRAK